MARARKRKYLTLRSARRPKLVELISVEEEKAPMSATTDHQRKSLEKRARYVPVKTNITRNRDLTDGSESGRGRALKTDHPY